MEDQEILPLVPPKVVARYLGMSEAWVKRHRETIPGALKVGCGAREFWRFNMRKVVAWQEQQEQERKRTSESLR